MDIIYVFFDMNAPYAGWEYRTAEILRQKGAHVVTVPTHFKIQLHPKTQADVVYCSNPASVEIACDIAQKFKVPFVVQFLDCPLEIRPERQKEWVKIRDISIKAKAWTAISNTAADMVRRYLRREVDHINYIGVDTELADMIPDEEREEQVTYLGSTAIHKGLYDALAAVGHIYPPPKCVYLFGQYDENQKWTMIKRSIVGLFPSKWEGFGLPPAEFLYAKKPCLCYPIPALKEIYGDALEYVESVKELATTIAKLMVQPDYRKMRGEEGYHYVLEVGLTLEKHADRLLKILEEAIG